MVGILVSFWEGLSSGVILVSGRVACPIFEASMFVLASVPGDFEDVVDSALSAPYPL